MEPPEKHGSAYYRTLTRNIVLIIVGVSVIPLILISGVLRYYFASFYEQKVLDHLKVVIREHQQNIDSFLNERLANIQIAAATYNYDELAEDALLRDRLANLQKYYSHGFVDLGLVNEQGFQVAYAGPFELRQAHYAQAPWFKEAIKRDFYISDVFPGLRGIPHFIVTARGEHKGEKYILRATVDFDSFNSLVESIRIGETGFAFILNRKGEFQTKPRSEVIPFKEPYLSFLNSDSKLDEKVGTIESPTWFGTGVIYVMARLKKGEWVLAFQQSEADAYSALYTARNITVVISLAGIVAIIVVAIVLTLRLVVRIAQVDREKEMMNEQIIEAGKLASLGELAAGIAHEINNPVAVMVEEAGWIQDLLDEEPPDTCPNRQEFQRSVNQIRSQGARCKQITHKLLSFARKTDPTPKKIQLNEVVRDAVSLCQQRVRYGNVKLISVLADDLPAVRISPTEAQQVFVNLINNAVDAVEPKGGTVKVTTRTEGNSVVVDIADDGTGIPKYVLPRIFDPFFTTKPVGKGTGLGLSICYGMVKKADGEISVNTAEGLGTTFHVKFPIRKDSTPEV
jgi:two-component system NtrC family sensor kinase